MIALHASGDAIFNTSGLETEQDMIMRKLLIASLVLLLLLTVYEVSCACGRAEYLIGQECCPMCGPGYYVRRHCTEYTSTTCVPCSPGSFTEAPNGLEACRSCAVCDSSAGLRVKRSCSFTSDTLCEPLEGHYCTDPIKDGCQGAVEHTKCLPGKYIKRPGSDTLDAECDDCVGETYSNGSFTSCKPHTRCEEKGLVVLTEGSTSQDTICESPPSNVSLIVGVILAVIIPAVACVAGLLICYLKRKKRKNDLDPPHENVSLSNHGGVQEQNKDGESEKPLVRRLTGDHGVQSPTPPPRWCTLETPEMGTLRNPENGRPTESRHKPQHQECQMVISSGGNLRNQQ